VHRVPAEDGIGMCRAVYTRVGMFDRAGMLNELFRFSTTDRKWELDGTPVSGFPPAPPVSGLPPSARSNHGMVSVGSNLYVFGGGTATGEEGLCDGYRLGACQIERPGDAPRAAGVPVATSCARAGCHAVPHQGLVTLDGTSPLSWHRESQRGR
jgi:hypothetical protein